ncbi:MAG: YbjQ family protein [Solirubrobacteraceae bacterium]
MLISTMNDLPGYQIEEVLGEVFGLTVRSRNVGSQIGASFKSLVGGELKGMTKMLAEETRACRHQRLVEAGQGRQRDRRVPLRHVELGTTWTEICAYGTAVRAQALTVDTGEYQPGLSNCATSPAVAYDAAMFPIAARIAASGRDRRRAGRRRRVRLRSHPAGGSPVGPPSSAPFTVLVVAASGSGLSLCTAASSTRRTS